MEKLICAICTKMTVGICDMGNIEKRILVSSGEMVDFELDGIFR